MTISENFTIKDIHQIRYANFEQTKNFTAQELIEKTTANATAFKLKLKKHCENKDFIAKEVQ